MSDQGFPNTYTTTTTTHATGSPSYVQLDLSYFRTLPGIMKCIEIGLNLLGFICITTSIRVYLSRGSFFNTIAMTGFWFTGIMLALYVFNVPNRLQQIPWLKIEFGFCAALTLFNAITASLAIDWRFDEAFAAAAFFGYCAMVCYGWETFHKFNEIKKERVAQKTIGVTATTTTTTTTY